jgi:hypothetical protein
MSACFLQSCLPEQTAADSYSVRFGPGARRIPDTATIACRPERTERDESAAELVQRGRCPANIHGLTPRRTAWCSYMTTRAGRQFLSHLRVASAAPARPRVACAHRRVDRSGPSTDLRRARRGQGLSMKGKGVGSSSSPRARSSMLRGVPVITRLTRTMGFVEQAHSPGVPDLEGTSGDSDPDLPGTGSPPR